MSDAILGALIGGAFGFVGVLLGLFANTWLENEKARREQVKEMRLRIVGNLIQTSEVMDLVRSQTGKDWPRFWRRTAPDLGRAQLEGVDLRSQDLQGAKLFRANLKKAALSETDLRQADLIEADLIETNLHLAKLTGAKLSGAHLNGADLSKANLTEADLSEANLTDAKVTDEQLLQAKSLEGAIKPDGTKHA